MPPLKIAFIPTNVSGVMFYRCWQPAEALRAMGCKVAVLWYKSDQFEMHPWEEHLLSEEYGHTIERDVEMACQWADAVVWMGLHTPQTIGLFHAMKAKYGKPFIMEMDDYVFSLPQANIASTVYTPGADLTRILLEQMRASDAMVVSTPYLADLYRPFNKRISVVENVIDLSLWRRQHSPSRRRVTIGWMGGGTHNEDHEMIVDAVREVLGAYDVQFSYVCGGRGPASYEGIPRLKWRHAYTDIKKYPKWIQKYGFDIGIAPLVDNNFNRGKSNLRWMEYSALGIPCVASPLPHFRESIRHGETGFLASTKEEWVETLGRLAEDANLRESIGAAARQELKEKWNPKVMGRKYKNMIEGLLNASSDQERSAKPDQPAHRRSEQPGVLV